MNKWVHFFSCASRRCLNLTVCRRMKLIIYVMHILSIFSIFFVHMRMIAFLRELNGCLLFFLHYFIYLKAIGKLLLRA